MRNLWRSVALSLFCGGVSILGGFPTAGTAAAPSPEPQLVLVENGESRMPIVVFADAPPRTRQAADELAEYIEKTSGARPEVLEGQPDPLPPSAVWVGYQPVLKKLFPDVDFEFQHPEEILIEANGKHLVIAGRDRWDPEHMVRHVRRRVVEGLQQEYGTVNAVYTFLQDYLDVRWLWPGEWGIDIVPRQTISFAPFTYRYHPQIRDRKGIFTLSALGDNRGVAFDWVRLQRLQLDSLERTAAGHDFNQWWDRFHETHPEYFALQPDGSRGGGENPYPSAGNVKMCKSNPALWQQWLADVEAALEQDPTRRIFGAGAGDGWRSGYCICENCRAWDHRDGERMLLNWEGLAQEYVAMSDRQVNFANKLGGLLKARFPDRELYVAILAYGASRPPPVEAVPADNVIVAGVHSLHRRREPDHRPDFVGWGKITPNFAWRPNLGTALHHPGLAHVSPAEVINDFRLVAANNVIGINFDTTWEHWATQGLHYYLSAQLAWNPSADGEAILEDYYRRGFGERAAEEFRGYWEMLIAAAHEVLFEEKTPEEVYSIAFLDRADGLLDRAEAKLADGPELYRRRVEFVRMGLDYTRYLMEVRGLMKQFRDGGERDQTLADRAREIWLEKILPLLVSTDHPHAFVETWLRPGSRYQGYEHGPYPADLLPQTGAWRTAVRNFRKKHQP